jgi:hypothetical protein
MFDKQKQQQNSRLGNILLKRQIVTQQQLDVALEYQQEHQLRLGEALMDMKLIDHQQLRSALRKQSWLRIATTCLTLTLTPFTPAFAATQGKVGNSSVATSQISLTILPETVNNKASNIQFDSDSYSQISSGFCTSNFNTDLYSISAQGSGNNGEFVLKDGQQNQLDYDVAYKYQGRSFDSLSDKKEIGIKNPKYFQNNNHSNLSVNCLDADKNRLKVSLKDQQNKANSSNYTGFLTITIAAE